MNIEALLKTADLVENAQPQGFDMNNFRNPLNPCGTTFCAFGLAIEHGVFPGYEWASEKGSLVISPTGCLLPSFIIDKLYGFVHSAGDSSLLSIAIFFPSINRGPYWTGTPSQSQVAAVIRYVAARQADEGSLGMELQLSRIYMSGQLEKQK